MNRLMLQQSTLQTNGAVLVQDILESGLSPGHTRSVYRWLRRDRAIRRDFGLAPGQIDHLAVAFPEPAWKPDDECRRVQVRLTLRAPSDLNYLRPGGGGALAMQRFRLLRIALEAVEQGGCLSLQDFASLLGTDELVVRWVIRDFHQCGVEIPVRGYGQKFGCGGSHRATAIRLYLQCIADCDVSCRPEFATIRPVRYLKDFAAVAQALTLGVPQYQIPMLVGLPARLVGEYIALQREYGCPELEPN